MGRGGAVESACRTPEIVSSMTQPSDPLATQPHVPDPTETADGPAEGEHRYPTVDRRQLLVVAEEKIRYRIDAYGAD